MARKYEKVINRVAKQIGKAQREKYGHANGEKPVQKTFGKEQRYPDCHGTEDP